MKRRIIIIGAALILALVATVTWALISPGEPTKQADGQPSTEEPCEEPPAEEDEPQEGSVKPSEEVVPPPSDDASPPPQQPEPKSEPRPEPTPQEICHGSTSTKQVIFTFDAGAGNQSLDAILAALKRHNVKGTFFVTGKWVEANRSQVERISHEGHEVFNHTYSHPNLTTISNEAIITELNKTDALIREVTGKSSKPYFRPPFGARNNNVLDVAWSQGYRSVYWTVDTLDWQESATQSSVRRKVLDNLNPGNIYLMHIGSTVTGSVIDEIFTEVKARGYRINSLMQGL